MMSIELKPDCKTKQQEHSAVSREFSMDMTQFFGSQVTKLSNIQRCFCPREILSGVKKIPLFWWKMCIRWRLRFLLHQIVSWWWCLDLLPGWTRGQAPPETKRRSWRNWMCYPATSIPSFHIGMCLLWKFLKFQARCYNDCATLQEKLKTSNQDFWKSTPLHTTLHLHSGISWTEAFL